MFIELDEGYDRHRKTLRLCALLKNTTADIYPPRLWLWAVRSAPDGVLTGMTPEEIEIAVRYAPCDGTLFRALVEAGFIDVQPDGITTIHDWEEHTGAAIRRMSKRADDMKELRAHKAGMCLSPCRHCERTGAARLPLRDANVQRSPVQSSPVQSSPVQSSPVKSGGEVLPRNGSHEPEPEPSTPTSARPLTRPDSPSNLIHVLGVIAREVAPQLGLWNPGPFAIRHADEFLASCPPDKREALCAELPKRAARFFGDQRETRFTVQRFAERWNELGEAPRRPARSYETPPDEVELAGVRLREENRRRIAAEQAAKAAAESKAT